MQRVTFRVLCGILAAGLLPSAAYAQLVTGPGPGRAPEVRVIEPGGAERTFMAYNPAFFGGVRVALGDVNGDGVRDIITAPGPGGGPHVRIWNGVDLTEIGGFFAYDPAFAGGVYVAAGDVDGDGRADIVTGADAGGGPHVRIWSGATLSEIGGFFAYDPAFGGGVRVATGDVNGDGREDIVTAPGAGGGPHVRIWSGQDLTEIWGFFAYDPAFAGGVSVAAADIDADGRADIVTGAGPGGGPHVRIWSGMTFAEIGGFFALDPTFTGGVVVGTVDLTTDERPDIVAGAAGGGPAVVGVWNGTDISFIGALLAYPQPFSGGVFVGSVGSTPGLRFTSAASTTLTAGSAGTFSVTTAGGDDVPALTMTGNLPSGVTFTDNGNRTATLAGTPGASTGGTYNLVFSADNGSSPVVTQNFTLTVNQAPAITSAASTTFTVGTPGTFTVTTTGFPTPTISSTVGLPTGVTLTDNGNGTATIAGTPAAGTGGTYPITITAMNGVGSVATQSFTLTVSDGPAITSANTTTFTVGGAGSFTVTTIGSPTPALTVSGALPAGVTFVDNGNGTGTLSGTPGGGTGGAYAVTFTASNGVLPNGTQNFTLTVHQAPAVTSANSTTFTIGVPGSFSVTTSGFPAAGLVQGGAALPGGVTFVDNANGTGTLSGTAGAGTAGPYALTFTASNGVGSPAVQNFTLTVACPAITVSPGAGALPGATFQQAYSQTFTALGGSSHTFSVTAGALPAGLTLATNGALTGSPTTTGNFSFTVTANSFGCTGSTSYTLAVAPNAADETFSNGVGNTQYVVAPSPTSSTPAVTATGTVLSNDAGPGSLSAGPSGIATANGGSVAMSSNGAFVYTPAVGFPGPADTFAYTLTDGNGATDTATVTINFSGVVWYVNSAGSNGDGRSHSPFNVTTNADAPSLPGHTIYVHAGLGPTPGSIVLKTGQTLWGAGAPFTLNGLLIPPGGFPTLAGTVTLADGVLVSAVRIDSPSGPAISGTNLTGTENLTNVNIIGGTSGIVLTNAGGTVNFNITSVSGLTTGPSLLVDGGNASMAGRLAITNTAGRSIDIQNKTGGNLTFGGGISDTGTGIFLNNNSGTTINFTGGLNLQTGTNPAFTATNSGTVNITQNNTSVINTIATTSGTALNITGTTIGASGVTFRSISANGASNGIILSNTGILGGLTVTGNGGVCSPTDTTCTGGRIRNTVGADSSSATPGGTGIVLNNTRSVSLNLMQLDNHSNYAIRGTSVNGFTFSNGLVDGANGTNASALFNDGSFVFLGVTGVSSGMTGTSAITNSTIQGGHQRNIAIDNSVGSLDLTVSGNTIRRTSDAAGDDGFFFEADTTATATVTITNNTFARHGGDHINLSLVNSAVVQAVITGNTLHGNYPGTPEGDHAIGLGQGIRIVGTNFDGTLGYTISNNGTVAVPFRGNRQRGAIHVSKVSGIGTFSGSIANNVLGDPLVIGSGSSEAFGIIVGARGAGGSHTTLIDNNLVRQYFLRGIVLEAGEGSAALNATVTNNTVSDFADLVSSLDGIFSNNGLSIGDTNVVCLAISGNSVATAGNDPGIGADIRLQRGFSTTVQLPGLVGTSDAAATVLLQSNNPTATSISVSGGSFSGGGGCITP